jgi:hypothetical protein
MSELGLGERRKPHELLWPTAWAARATWDARISQILYAREDHWHRQGWGRNALRTYLIQSFYIFLWNEICCFWYIFLFP